MVSPPSKLKMFTVSVCVLLTSVPLNLVKRKIKSIYATTSSWQKNKMAGERWVTPSDFIFLFMIRVEFFYDPSWSESSFIFSLLFYSIRVDPSWSDPDWRSELIRSDYWTCLAKMFVSPVPKIPYVMMKWCLRRFTVWHYFRLATQLSRFTLWQNTRWAPQLAGKFTLWHNERRAKQPCLMHAPGVTRIFQTKKWRLNPE